MLPLLGLLVEQPSHAYGLTSRLCERYGRSTATRSTVTSLLKSLEKAGLVASRQPEQVGKRPPRTVYELTEAGVADFRRRVEAGLGEGETASADFVMAVAYAAILPAEQAADLLDARAERVEREAARLRERPDGVAEAHMLEAAYWHTIAAAEAEWLRMLAVRIRERDIDWPDGSSDGRGGVGA